MSHGLLQPTTQAAILYSNDDFGRGLSEAFATAYPGLGGAIVRSDPYLRGMEGFGPYLERLRRNSVRVVLIAGLDAEARRIIQQARRMGIQARFIGSSALERLAGGGTDFQGTLRFDAQGDPREKTYVVGVIRDGGLQIVQDGGR